MHEITDIPDWAIYEATGEWTDFKTVPTAEQREKM
jgi:hypothetical protein